MKYETLQRKPQIQHHQHHNKTMLTNYVPLFVGLFHYSYEAEFIQILIKNKIINN